MRGGGNRKEERAIIRQECSTKDPVPKWPTDKN